jgi:hypothetical protein
MGKMVCKTRDGMTVTGAIDFFSLVGLLHGKIFSTLMLKTGRFIYNPIPFSSGINIGWDTCFLGLWTEAIFSIGQWLIRCYLAIQELIHFQFAITNNFRASGICAITVQVCSKHGNLTDLNLENYVAIIEFDKFNCTPSKST